MKHINIVIDGHVQGVGFRHAAKQQARQLGLNGYVKNRNDGSVYIEAEGEENILAAFVGWCRQGPPFAEVEKVEVSDAEIVYFSIFETRF